MHSHSVSGHFRDNAAATAADTTAVPTNATGISGTTSSRTVAADMVRGRNISVGGPVGLFVKFTVVLVFFRLFADVACPATFVVAAAGAGGTRPKRQLPPLEQGDQVIDNIFQVLRTGCIRIRINGLTGSAFCLF